MKEALDFLWNAVLIVASYAVALYLAFLAYECIHWLLHMNDFLLSVGY